MRSIISSDTAAYEEEKSVIWSIGRATIIPMIHGKKKITWSTHKKHSKNTSYSTRSHDPLLNTAFCLWTTLDPDYTFTDVISESTRMIQINVNLGALHI